VGGANHHVLENGLSDITKQSIDVMCSEKRYFLFSWRLLGKFTNLDENFKHNSSEKEKPVNMKVMCLPTKYSLLGAM